MKTKKAGYDFAIYAPFTLILLAIMLIIFGIYFFQFSGASTKDITIKSTLLPDPTLRNLMEIKTDSGDTMNALFLNTFFDMTIMNQGICSGIYNLDECIPKAKALTIEKNIETFSAELKRYLPKVLGEKSLWVLSAYQYPTNKKPVITFFIESEKELDNEYGNGKFGPYHHSIAQGNMNAPLRTSTLILPIPNKEIYLLDGTVEIKLNFILEKDLSKSSSMKIKI